MAYASDFLKIEGIKLYNKSNNKRILNEGKNIEVDESFPLLIEGLNTVKAIFGRMFPEERFLEYEEIKKYGWVICKSPMSYYDSKWYPSQSYYFILHNSSKIPPTGSSVLLELPDEVKIKLIVKSRRIRLEGKNCGPNWHGRFKPLDLGGKDE